jgi:ubiquinone/menaquinone biosynthesis C-methylase UbiE
MSDSAAFIGNIPEHYDRGLGPVMFSGYAEALARQVAATGPDRVLETAAGTGIVTRALRDALPAGTALTATDLNPPMLAIAAAKFAAGAKVSFQPADAQALPFPDASFDAVVCSFGIMFYPDKPKGYREAHRVLIPGGRYHFSVWDSLRHNPYARIPHETVRRLFPADPPGFYDVPVCCAAIDPVKEALIDAGFTAIAVAVVSLVKEVADPPRFARALIFGNATAEQIQQRGGDPERAVAIVLERLGAELGTAPMRMPLQAILYSARKPD